MQLRARGQSCARILTFIENKSIFENLSMFENFSISLQKSGKGRREMPRHFPARLITRKVVLSQMRVCYVFMCSALLPKIFINKLPRLASAPLAEVVLVLCRHKE